MHRVPTDTRRLIRPPGPPGPVGGNGEISFARGDGMWLGGNKTARSASEKGAVRAGARGEAVQVGFLLGVPWEGSGVGSGEGRCGERPWKPRGGALL